MVEAEVRKRDKDSAVFAAFEDGRRDHEPKKAGSF